MGGNFTRQGYKSGQSPSDCSPKKSGKVNREAVFVFLLPSPLLSFTPSSRSLSKPPSLCSNGRSSCCKNGFSLAFPVSYTHLFFSLVFLPCLFCFACTFHFFKSKEYCDVFLGNYVYKNICKTFSRKCEKKFQSSISKHQPKGEKKKQREKTTV